MLIIDDNIDIRTYLRSVLSEKYNVSEAADGKAGLELARKIVPDIVLSDIMMPVMDGLAFCQQLKTDKAISHIPVILLTARSLDEQRAEGYEHGADAYLSKPFSLRLLFSRIDNLIQSRKKLSKLFSNSDENDAFEKLSNETDKTFAAQLRKIIQDNLSDNEFNVERIGDEIGLSRVQLYRKVKALTGYSPVEMLRKARLTRARHLLRTTEKTVSEVAYAVGFSTPSYFLNFFISFLQYSKAFQIISLVYHISSFFNSKSSVLQVFFVILFSPPIQRWQFLDFCNLCCYNEGVNQQRSINHERI